MPRKGPHMFTIEKTWSLDAAHSLPELPKEHKCSRVHGHTYRITLRLLGELDSRGMVIDYGDLKPFGRYLNDQFDHRSLNDTLGDQSTAERFAEHLYELVPVLLDHVTPILTGTVVFEVGVSETPNTWAWCA